MKIIFMGSDSFVVPVLQALQENFEVITVVTAPDSAVSRFFKGQILTPDKLDENFISQIQKLEPDLIVVSSYGKIIPQIILDIPKFGSLNVHPSLLPKFRGASPVPAVILAGETSTGVTIIKMDEKMDHGPILITRSFKLSGKEILPELITKLFQLGAELLVTIIPDFISGKLVPKVQDHTKATFCKMMKKEDGYFDLNTPPSAEELDRMTRAYNPWPGVWTTWNGKIVKFVPNIRHSVRPSAGYFLSRIDSGVPWTSQGPQNDKFLIQMEGKKIMPLKDFLNGYPDFPMGKVFAWR